MRPPQALTIFDGGRTAAGQPGGAPVRFSLFPHPGLSASDVVIHEDPSIGFEPIAYVDPLTVRPSILPLLGGRFVIAAIRLDDATITLTKSGPASEPGRWAWATPCSM